MSQVAEGIENMASELNKVAGSLLSDWYNAVIHDLNLDPHTFQLMPGCLPLEKDDKIWEMFDSIPPLSDDHYYDPSQLNRLSTNYGAVINNLRPFDQSRLNAFYNKYGDAIDNLLTKEDLQSKRTIQLNNILKNSSQFEYFKNFSILINAKEGLNAFRDLIRMNMPISQASIALEMFEASIHQPVIDAIDKWTKSGGEGAMKVYDGTMNSLRLKLKSAPGAKVTMSELQKLGNASGSGIDGQTSAADLKTSLTNSDTIVTTTYQHIIEFTATPLSEQSTDPNLSNFEPWYHFPANKLAYENKDIWKNVAPTWEDMFGQVGAMKRICHTLFVVDGVSTTITGQLAKNTATMIMDLKNEARSESFNFMPLLLWGRDMDVKVQDAPKISEETSSDEIVLSRPVGNPYVLGVNIISIEGFLKSYLI